jgi:hypothetical protein
MALCNFNLGPFLIPISETCPEFYVAFYAAVVKLNEGSYVLQGETAWGYG